MLSERTGWDKAEVAAQLDALIITQGAGGSLLVTSEGETQIESVEADAIEDPTGCGDAYRGGLIFGMQSNLDLVTSCRIGSVMGALKVAVQGPQNHWHTPEEIGARFEAAFGYSFLD